MKSAPVVFALEEGYYDSDADAGKEVVPLTPCLSLFSSVHVAAAKREGIDIAEGDLHFFASDGSPLKALFSKEPYIDNDRKKYFPGVYSLQPESGEGLQGSLAKVLAQNQSSHARIIVYKPDNDEDAQWYGWQDAKTMGAAIEQALNILPSEMLKQVRFE